MATKFAAAFGAYKLAEIEAGGFVDREADADRRLHEAEEALIAIRSPDRAGIMGKLERVAEHARDSDYGRLSDELDACQRELSAANADLDHVAAALRVLARRFEGEEMPSVWVRFLRSAADDAAALAA